MRPRTSPLSEAELRALVEYEARHAEWRAADEVARTAEAAVAAAAEASAAGSAPAAGVEQCEAAIRLRAVANRLLEEALAVVRRDPL